MTDFWQDTPELRERLERVTSLMLRTVRTPDFPLGEEVSQLVTSTGKMLRPALLIIGARFGKPDWDKTIALAASIELLHVSTLIHDDIIDEAELRRGVPTLHTRMGTKEAVLAGDWLFSRCFQLAAESATPENALRLARLVGAICSAEIRQDLTKWKYSTSVREYLRKIAGKTAALFSLALHTGSIEAKAPLPVVEHLRRAGYDIGMAFQIMDDILDFASNENEMGKPVGKDVREGLCTLPLIFALGADGPGMISLLTALPRHEGEETDRIVSTIIRRTIELDGVEKARELASRFTQRALGEIDRLPAKEARNDLIALTEKLFVRNH